LEVSELTGNLNNSGNLKDAIIDADVFIGVSKGGILKGSDIRKMSKKPIIFALANPVPEIFPDEAYEDGAFIVATGRSDFPNQVNNLLAFPGIMKVAVEKQVKITKEMLIRAAEILSNVIEPTKECILPKATDRRVHDELYYGLLQFVNSII
ncbi:MAG TPA: malic enzyme-like NAD(P)-binding protein, partial [Fervidobacterium nodosum]|nr:malic enzyme-like NAD(P)-binding protein [Fervidobacterium nodosum]